MRTHNAPKGVIMMIDEEKVELCVNIPYLNILSRAGTARVSVYQTTHCASTSDFVRLLGSSKVPAYYALNNFAARRVVRVSCLPPRAANRTGSRSMNITANSTLFPDLTRTTRPRKREGPIYLSDFELKRRTYSPTLPAPTANDAHSAFVLRLFHLCVPHTLQINTRRQSC
jgi:hypothetical protein